MSVAALGIGSMVGAGVFALLGQVALLVGGRDTRVAFAVGGVARPLSPGYSYARLSGRVTPGRGGIIDYFAVRASDSPLAGAAACRCCILVTLALTVAMVAKAFGAYGARLFHDPPTHLERVDSLRERDHRGAGDPQHGGLRARWVRAELALVADQAAAILGVRYRGGRGYTCSPAMLEVHGDRADPGTLLSLASVGLAFFAYAGYGMMANAAEAVPTPLAACRAPSRWRSAPCSCSTWCWRWWCWATVSSEDLAQLRGHGRGRGRRARSSATRASCWSRWRRLLARRVGDQRHPLFDDFIIFGMGARGTLPAMLVKPLLGHVRAGRRAAGDHLGSH
ncbi:MAG: hypothetical protein MZV65_31205 [Chromatiales bacterium]|nr:hypothetical protein [Chromatiales bacterium]